MGADYSLSVCGVKPKDAKYDNMLKVMLACREAKVDPPAPVLAYFNADCYEEASINPHGIIEEYASLNIEYEREPKGLIPALEYFSDEEDGHAEKGFYIDIGKLPPDIKLLRVSIDCSY